jgi:hypothetical protein
MALGEEGDFRTLGFQQVLRFPAQDKLGGSGSPFPLQLTTPFGSTNMQSPVAPMNLPALGNPNITFPGVSLPPALPPVVIQPATAGIGTGGPATITVEDLATPAGPFLGIDTLQFDGSVTVANPTPNVAVVTVGGGGGGGGGTTVYHGKITGAVKGTYAQWTYTVDIYVGGVLFSTVTAYNTLEIENDTTLAYGYSITGAGYDKVFGTSYYVRQVPIGAWVSLIQTTDLPASGGLNWWWFNAPNRIDGGC